jgi:5-methylcytosine-specific restriction endonuclease McrA
MPKAAKPEIPPILVKVAGCPPGHPRPEGKTISRLRLGQPFWDLLCPECGVPALRYFDISRLRKMPASALCNKCSAPFLLSVVRQSKDRFSVRVEPDYSGPDDKDWSQVYETRRKRTKLHRTVIAKVYPKGKGRCYLCRVKIRLSDYGITWTIDHDIPISRHGTDDLENLWPACRSCNRSKHNATAAEFRAGKSYVTGSDL